MKLLHLALILLSLSDVLTQNSNWGVKYPQKPICAVRGFNVSIPCSYYYPTSKPIQVKQMLWCSMNSNTDQCHHPPYVYNSASNTKSDFEFTGDDKSDCTLLIHNVQFNYSGEYKFRFITDVTDGMWTGNPGVTLQVTDSVETKTSNLTNDVNSTQSSSKVVSSKSVPVSGPKNPVWSIWTIVYVIAGVSLIVPVILGAVIYNRRRVQQEQDVSDLHANVQQKKDDSGLHANIQQKEDDSDIFSNVQQMEDDSDIYSNVQQMEDNSDIYSNVQQMEDDSDIYANVQQKYDSDFHANAQLSSSVCEFPL